MVYYDIAEHLLWLSPVAEPEICNGRAVPERFMGPKKGFYVKLELFLHQNSSEDQNKLCTRN